MSILHEGTKELILAIAPRMQAAKNRVKKADEQVAMWEIEKKAAGRNWADVCAEWNDILYSEMNKEGLEACPRETIPTS